MHLHKITLYVLLALPSPSLLASALTDKQHQTITDGAQQAQTACYKQIYRDTNGYSQCLRELVAPEKRNAFRRLGMEYFGYVGAMAYVRVSQVGAEQVAVEFLNKYRSTQKRLGVADQALCATVPGNCTVRIAQGKALEAAPPTPPAMGVQCLGGVCRIAPKE